MSDDNLAKPYVIICDDDELPRTFEIEIATRAGFVVHSFDQGVALDTPENLELVRGAHAIITDGYMPKSTVLTPRNNGGLFAQELRCRVGYKGKIAIITGAHSDFAAYEAPDLVNVVLSKPINADDITRFLQS